MDKDTKYKAKLLTYTYPFMRIMGEEEIKLVGRKEELSLLEESFYKRRMKNTLLVGPAGSGKTAIVEQFAKNVKDRYIIMSLDLSGMMAGTNLRGQFEEKVFNCFKDIIDFNIKYNDIIVLFIDEIHMIYKLGQCIEGDTSTLGNMMKPYLVSPHVSVIGATTLDEYKETILRDKALNRRLSPVLIKPLEDKTNLKILDNFAEKTVGIDLLEYILAESNSIPNSQNPDIAIEILDRCLARRDYQKKEIDKKMVDNVIKYVKELQEEM